MSNNSPRQSRATFTAAGCEISGLKTNRRKSTRDPLRSSSGQHRATSRSKASAASRRRWLQQLSATQMCCPSARYLARGLNLAGAATRKRPSHLAPIQTPPTGPRRGQGTLAGGASGARPKTSLLDGPALGGKRSGSRSSRRFFHDDVGGSPTTKATATTWSSAGVLTVAATAAVVGWGLATAAAQQDGFPLSFMGGSMLFDSKGGPFGSGSTPKYASMAEMQTVGQPL